MFRDLIRKPIDPIPENYINSLNRLELEPDFSLTCLGIALLKPRVEDYKGIKGVYYSFNDENKCLENFLHQYKSNNDLNFYYYKYAEETQDADEFNHKLTEAGFEIKDTICALMKDKIGIRCVAAYRKDENCAVIFVNSSDLKIYHFLISFISLLFPSLFVDMPLRPEDYEVVKSLSKSSSAVFSEKISEAVQPYAIEFKKSMLFNLLKSMHESKILGAQQDIDNMRSRIDMIENEHAEAIKQLRRFIIVYEGMKATENLDEQEEELIEYLSKNKQIRNMEVQDDVLYFTVATLLNNYNADAWETFVKRGYILTENYHTSLLSVFTDKDNKKLLLNSIFSETPEFSVKICGNYSIDLTSCRVRTDKVFDYVGTDQIYKSYIPNPHLKLFACLGGYSNNIMKALKDRNFISAVELCCASAGSVNLDETEQTFKPFLGWILSSREKILRRKDGVDMTPEEALIYLIDKE